MKIALSEKTNIYLVSVIIARNSFGVRQKQETLVFYFNRVDNGCRTFQSKVFENEINGYYWQTLDLNLGQV